MYGNACGAFFVNNFPNHTYVLFQIWDLTKIHATAITHVDLPETVMKMRDLLHFHVGAWNFGRNTEVKLVIEEKFMYS